MRRPSPVPWRRTLAAWGLALLLFVPLLWLGLTAFKTEQQAIAVPPTLWFSPTLQTFAEVHARSDYLVHARNSLVSSVASTALGLLLAVPAAHAMAFLRVRRTRGWLMWMLSTRMMPAVGALVPVYVLAQTFGLLDSLWSLVIVFTLTNLPLMVWLLYAAFKAVPRDLLEAARLDGASVWGEFRDVVLPLTRGGIGSTALLCGVLAWNEAFWSLNLTSANASTLAGMIASYASPEGLFWARLSAASLLAIGP